MSGTWIEIEIAYAEPLRSIVKTLRLPAASNIADALRLAALDADFAGVALASAPLGIYGKPASRERLLRHGDRLEIYRALIADPKVARRTRAASQASRPQAPSKSCRS